MIAALAPAGGSGWQQHVPVVVKTAAAGAHKSDTGGVVLDLGDEEEVRGYGELLRPPYRGRLAMVGGGTRALPAGLHLGLELVDQRRFGNGVVYLRYRVG